MKADPDLFSASSGAERMSRNRRLVWFVAGAVLIMIAMAAFMSAQKGLFKRTTQLHFFADSAKGMAPGMAVKLNGFKVGTLDNLIMDRGGRVSAVLLVGDEYAHLIHKDAKARWTKESLIGESVIEILSGTEIAPTVENNAVIAFERTRDVTEELSKLANQLQPILADVKSITTYADSPEGDVKIALQQLRRATTALANASEAVNDITRSNKKQVHSAINSASGALNKLDAALPPLIKRVEVSLQHVEGTAADARAITGKLMTELPPAVSEGRETLRDTHEMVNAVKESWPIRNLLPPQDEHSLPLDSYAPSRP